MYFILGLGRFADKEFKIPLSYLKDSDYYSKDKWKLPHPYDFYFCVGILIHAYESKTEIGMVMEIDALGKERFNIAKKDLDKFEKKKFDNWYELTYYHATTEKYCKSFAYILIDKVFAYNVEDKEEPVKELEYTADRNRQETLTTADRIRPDTPIAAETDRLNIADDQSSESSVGGIFNNYVNNDDAEMYNQMDEQSLHVFYNKEDTKIDVVDELFVERDEDGGINDK